MIPQVDGEGQPDLVGMVLRSYIPTVGTVPFLDPHPLEGSSTGGEDAEVPTRVVEQVPEVQTVIGRGVELIAGLAYVGQLHGGDWGPADIYLAAPEITQRPVVQVCGAKPRQQRLGRWAPQPGTAGPAGYIPDRNAPVSRHVAHHPRLVRRAVSANLEAGSTEPGDGDVRQHVGTVVEHESVDHAAGGSVDPSRRDLLEEPECAWPADLQPAERCHVEQSYAVARRLVLSAHDGRPEPRGPALAGGDPPPCHLAGVGLVPLGPLPTVRLGHLRAQGDLSAREGARSHPAGLGDGLERVDDVVDLDEGPDGARYEVRLGPHGTFEAPEIALVQVDAQGLAPYHRRRGARHPESVGDPHRFGDKKAADRLCFTHKGEAICSEGEQALHGVL